VDQAWEVQEWAAQVVCQATLVAQPVFDRKVSYIYFQLKKDIFENFLSKYL
jgi:hypothetical protein